MDVQTAIDRFLAAPGVSDSTRRAYRADLRHFAAWLGDRPLERADVRLLAE